jgi:DNA-binding LytR/AlgR family response regulator
MNFPATKITIMEEMKAPTYFFIKADYRLVKINISDITHIEGMKDYIKIHLTSQPKPIIPRMCLKHIEEKLGASDFMRVHKSYVVAIHKIEAIRNNQIFIGKYIIPISDSFKETVLNWVGV